MSPKKLVEDSSTIDISALRDALADGVGTSGAIAWSQGGSEIERVYFLLVQDGDGLAVRLSYHMTGNEIAYIVGTTTTPCHLGGERFWFLCPARRCGRRVKKLYRHRTGSYYVCRDCGDLTYKSCRDSGKYRSLWRGLDSQNHKQG